MTKRPVPKHDEPADRAWRKKKRYFRKSGMDDPVYIAHLKGECDNYDRIPKRNLYPPGRRHDTYDSSYDNADPLGGRNCE